MPRKFTEEPAARMAAPVLAAVAALALQVFVGQGQGSIGPPECNTTCGNVSVPYPFGINPRCAMPGFNLTCDTSSNTPRLLLGNGTLQDTTPQDECFGTHCCRQTMPISRTSYNLHLQTVFDISSDLPNDFVALIAEEGWLEKNITKALFYAKKKEIPMVLSWTIKGGTCPKDQVETACKSDHSFCTSNNGLNSNHTRGYICHCQDGYEGNPYLTYGCQDIDECLLPDKCYGSCTNTLGSYLCECEGRGRGNPYIPYGCLLKPRASAVLGVSLGLVGFGVLLLILGIRFLSRNIKERIKKKQQRFLRQNRVHLLNQLVNGRADIAERMIITLKELQKATNHFDKAYELGCGGHGTVYKAVLSSQHVVAIKKPKIVVQGEINDFINEVAILSQINHKNIVKLYGCCLETEVPLLVFEFVTNGTLYDHLHVEDPISLSWRDRLRITVETARALTYLHSFVSMPIIHRDIKSLNILLDENLTVKLSDFGASRHVPIDQTKMDTAIQGTIGYLDPMYYKTGHLSEKSDVYSFGVILIELLTRKKPVSYISIGGHDLVEHFVSLLSEHKLDYILDPQVTREGDGEVIDVALLAAICVKSIREERPTMRQVEMTLESIYEAKDFLSRDVKDDESESEDSLSLGATNTEAIRIVVHDEALTPN
ncbi:hypothetical protein ACP4OV_027161 [Aristida adscensionis]